MNKRIIFNSGVKQRKLVAAFVLFVILRLLWPNLWPGWVKILVMDQNYLWAINYGQGFIGEIT